MCHREHARRVQRLEDGCYSLGNEVARLHAIRAGLSTLDHLVLPDLHFRMLRAVVLAGLGRHD
jgi:hypothetical protein